MATAADNLKKAAQDAADHTQGLISALDAKLAAIEREKAELDANRLTLRGALQRAADYPVTSGADYLCPICWVEDGKSAVMKPMHIQTADDIFQCRVCHYQANVGRG
jgi:hypothetical protein